jgi:hypothetical protein
MCALHRAITLSSSTGQSTYPELHRQVRDSRVTYMLNRCTVVAVQYKYCASWTVLASVVLRIHLSK